MSAEPIPFNRPYRTGQEGELLARSFASGWTGGNGPFTARCEELLRELTGSAHVLLTPSCTAALEMAALLSGVGPGDEVILPSFTFVSTANAFVMRGATPVFVDVDADTLCLDPALAAGAVTDRTRVIAPVHYGGVGADMGALAAVASGAGADLVEDAAQCIGASRRGRPLGSIGALGALSFHETKNVSCGEGGALLINDDAWRERAEVLQEKGTSRARFARGEVDRYTWVDLGSSYLMADTTAAVLSAQLERVHEINADRMRVWDRYHAALAPLEAQGRLRRPVVPDGCDHNAHLYHVRFEDRPMRVRVAAALAERGISAYFHYVPLHSSPAGLRYGRVHGPMTVTDAAGDGLLRLPLFHGLSDADADRVVDALAAAVRA